MTDKLTIEIDGRVCEAAPGEMIIAVADRLGIHIPRFCYHKKLSIAANCRMCLVEAEQGGRPFPKPVPACATPVAAGMKVQTRSPKAIEAQRGTMEFLLINHPLDCPICDQGGECELQDVAMGYGGDVSRYAESKRVVIDEDLGPLIATDMTRCIHCTRCVRFGAEIAGMRELGATGRGEDMRIGTYVAHSLEHELSGNIIDLCPVGALTSKPYRFAARAWELTARDSISPHDGLGANLRLHVRRDRVLRVHPRENEAVNETWISDRDRFGYLGLTSPDRLTVPLVKEHGVWRELDWSAALRLAAERLKAADPARTGWLLSPTATLEELWLAQRIARGLGCPNLDHRLRQQDFSADGVDPALPWLGVSIAELETRQAILLIGSDIRQEQPLLAHRLRKAALAGGQIDCVNPLSLALNHPARQFVGTPAAMVEHLAAIAQALEVRAGGALGRLIEAARPDDGHRAAAAALNAAGDQDEGSILLGALATAHPEYALLKGLARAIAETSGCRIGHLPAAANSVGAPLVGVHPAIAPGGLPADPPGRTVAGMLDGALAGELDTFVLWGLEPDLDLHHPARARRALTAAGTVIACSAFRTPALEAVAGLLLPIGAFAETAGTFVNASGDWQSFQGAIAPPGEARPGWKVLRVLGNLLDLPDFDHGDAAEVRAALAEVCAQSLFDNRPRGPYPAERQSGAAGGEGGLIRVGTLPIHAADALVRRSPPLQRVAVAGGRAAVYLHPEQAGRLGLGEGSWVEVRQPDMDDGAMAGAGTAADPGVRLPVVLDAALPLGVARIPVGVAGTAALGAQIGPVELTRVADESPAPSEG